MTRRICEVENCERPRGGTNRVCSYHLAVHDPVPEHYVAKERTCLRCGEGFASAFAGDRICSPCRDGEYRAEKEAVKRGQTPAHYVGPFEPIGVPGIGG